MGSIFDSKRFSDFNYSKRPRRRKIYHRRKRIINNRFEATIALFILLAFGIGIIIYYSGDIPSASSKLTGTYKGTVGLVESPSPITFLFTEDTITTYVGEDDASPITQEYSLSTIGDREVITLTYIDTEDSISFDLTRDENCISFSDVDACKVASSTELLYICLVIGFFVFCLVTLILWVFRRRIFKRRNRVHYSGKVRVAIPTATQQQVYARARGRCERPHCSYSGKLHLHHIDVNPSNNSPTNIIAICPNCHSRIHAGEFSIDAQRSWIAS